MKPKHLVFVSYGTYPSVKGGAEVFNYHLMTELAAGRRVSCLCYGRDTVPKVDMMPLPMLKPIKLFAPLQTAAALVKLRLMSRSYRNKIILTYNRSSLVHWIYYPLLKFLLSFEYVIIVHDSDFTPWVPAPLFRLVFRRAARVFGVSRLVCEEYEARTGREVIELRPFIPFTKPAIGKEELRDRYGIPRDARVVLFVGSLKPVKQPLVFLEALEGISESQYASLRLHVLIIGDGPLRHLIEQRIRDSPISRFVRLLGTVEREELPSYYALSDLYVMTSLREAFPISLMEAIVYALAIVGADSPGINSLIKDGFNGLLFNPQDPADLRQKILLLAGDTGLRSALTNHLELGLEFEAGFKKTVQSLLEHLRTP